MTDYTFRPVEFWKSAIMTMADNSFFELMRSVFGKIKTPFNKQQLINDLEIFLLREDIQKAMTAYIDINDIKIITAVAVFDEPAPDELCGFFEGELNYAQLQDVIVNLEERFILYRFNDENSSLKGKPVQRKHISRLALNPVLEPVLHQFTSDISVLFPQTPVMIESDRIANSENFNTGIIISDLILAGLFSFVSRNEPFYKSEGIIRKRVIDAGKIHFPNIDLPKVLSSLQILGLFYAEADNLVPDKKRFNDFSSLSAYERSEYFAAALLIYNELNYQQEILSPLFKTRIREIKGIIHCLTEFLDADYLYPEQFLKRLIEIIKHKTDTVISSDELLDVLEKTGLLIAESSQYRKTGMAAKTIPNKEKECPFIAVDSDSSVLVYPEIEFTDALKLAAVAYIQEAGEVVRFEINKDSIVRAFDNSINADEIIDLLKRLSCNRIDEALIWNINDWEKRYNEVSLKKGVILKLSEDRHYLAGITPLADMIIETLAPGLYLLPENAVDRASTVLQDAGIDIIAHNKVKSAAGIISNKYFSGTEDTLLSDTTLEKILNMPLTDFNKLPEYQTDNNAAALIKSFHDILKEKPVSETGFTELSARINRRLILCESQLGETNVRYEKLEARHMDYAGKQNIAKQAIAQQLPVEITWLDNGKEKNILGIPAAFEKEDGELILVIQPVISNLQYETENIRVNLAKISLIRRIKKSIFEI